MKRKAIRLFSVLLISCLCMLLFLALPAAAEPEDSSEPAPSASEAQPPAPSENDPPAAPETDPPAAPEPDLPAVPETDLPAAPETDLPAVPETDPPAAPETDLPAVPETDLPAAPETDLPAVPETDPPAAPETDPPAAPETDPPAAPKPTPTQPSPAQPAVPAETDPVLILEPAPEVRPPAEVQIEFTGSDGNPYYEIPADWTAADVINWFILHYGLDQSHFSVAFSCPDTGERYAWNENAFMLAASTYKLPLNMYYYEKENEGVWSGSMQIGGTTLSTAHCQSIVWSMNGISHAMIHRLGTYRDYKRLMLEHYGGMDESEVPGEFWEDNYYSTRFMLNTLTYLYEHADSFGQLNEYLLQAKPDRYLQKYRGSVPVAHKYGTLYGHENDVGIIYTEQPFLAAIYTQYVYAPVGGEELIARLGAALIAYQTQRTELDKIPPAPSEETAPETAVPETTLPETDAPAEPETTAPAATPAPTLPAETDSPASAEPERGKTAWYFYVFPLIIVVSAVCGVLLFRKR